MQYCYNKHFLTGCVALLKSILFNCRFVDGILLYDYVERRAMEGHKSQTEARMIGTAAPLMEVQSGKFLLSIICTSSPIFKYVMCLCRRCANFTTLRV